MKTSISIFKISSPLQRLSGSKITILFIALFMIGCSYYKVKKVDETEISISAEIEKYNTENRYVILHSGDTEKHLSSIIINADKNELTARTKDINARHTYYEPRRNKRVNKYNVDKGQPASEVHFYTNTKLDLTGQSEISLPFSNIDSIKVYDKAIGRTVAMVTLTTVGALVVVSAIVAATKSSCPFVYVFDGKSYVFEGELYPGAIRKNLERDDYLLLRNLKEKNGFYSIRVSNELKEIQYTNLLSLIEVTHPKEQDVLMDTYGKIHTITKPVSPINMIANNSKKSLNPILNKDHIPYMFNENELNNDNLSNLILEFEKPENIKSSKLVLTLKNSYWLDYIYGKFNEKFGSYFNTFQKDQNKVPAVESMQWMIDQGIPLSVYIKSANGWDFVQYINVVGPLEKRNLVIPLNFEKLNTDKISIKLECGFMFWEIDYAAMDFSENSPVEISIIQPTSAYDENLNDVKNLLLTADNSYFIQPKIGNVATIYFDATKSVQNDFKKTLFLKNRGYYEYIRDYNGIPNFVVLKSFKEKGAFTQFSKEEYFSFIARPNMLDLIVSK